MYRQYGLSYDWNTSASITQYKIEYINKLSCTTWRIILVTKIITKSWWDDYEVIISYVILYHEGQPSREL